MTSDDWEQALKVGAQRRLDGRARRRSVREYKNTTGADDQTPEARGYWGEIAFGRATGITPTPRFKELRDPDFALADARTVDVKTCWKEGGPFRLNHPEDDTLSFDVGVLIWRLTDSTALLRGWVDRAGFRRARRQGRFKRPGGEVKLWYVPLEEMWPVQDLLRPPRSLCVEIDAGLGRTLHVATDAAALARLERAGVPRGSIWTRAEVAELRRRGVTPADARAAAEVKLLTDGRVSDGRSA